MWNYNYTDELCHYGVPGMRWGRRKSTSSSSGKATKAKTELTPEQKKARNKKIVGGILAGIGAAAVAAGTVAYIKNKDKVDSSVKKFFTKNKPTLKTKAANKRITKFAKNAASKSPADIEAQNKYLESILKNRELSSKVTKPGRAAVAKILATAGTSAATTMITGGILYGTKAAVTKNVDRKDAMDYITPKPKKK